MTSLPSAGQHPGKDFGPVLPGREPEAPRGRVQTHQGARVPRAARLVGRDRPRRHRAEASGGERHTPPSRHTRGDGPGSKQPRFQKEAPANSWAAGVTQSGRRLGHRRSLVPGRRRRRSARPRCCRVPAGLAPEAARGCVQTTGGWAVTGQSRGGRPARTEGRGAERRTLSLPPGCQGAAAAGRGRDAGPISVRTAVQKTLSTTKAWLRGIFSKSMFQRSRVSVFTEVEFTYKREMQVSGRQHRAWGGGLHRDATRRGLSAPRARGAQLGVGRCGPGPGLRVPAAPQPGAGGHVLVTPPAGALASGTPCREGAPGR